MRSSNVLTAVSNILMGFLLAAGSWQPAGALLLLIGASVALYCSGMVLNDVFDLERDRQLQPQRPLPSGRIELWRAVSLGAGLMLTGILLAFVVTLLAPQPERGVNSGQSGLVALGLAACILAYDGGGKNLPFGPLLMGGCRTLNVLLGCSIGAAPKYAVLGFEPIQWLVAMAIGVYVAGITWFARHEHESSRRWKLTWSALVMLAGIGILGLQIPELTMRHRAEAAVNPSSVAISIVLLVMLILPVLRRIVIAVRRPDSAHVKRAVVVSLLTLIMIDAAICYFLAMDQPTYFLTVAVLVVPTYWLGRWIRPT